MMGKEPQIEPLDPEQMIPPPEPEPEHFWDDDLAHDVQAMFAEANEDTPT